MTERTELEAEYQRGVAAGLEASQWETYARERDKARGERDTWKRSREHIAELFMSSMDTYFDRLNESDKVISSLREQLASCEAVRDRYASELADTLSELQAAREYLNFEGDSEMVSEMIDDEAKGGDDGK